MSSGVLSYKGVLISVVLIGLLITDGRAQIVGNPITNLQSNEWSAGAFAELTSVTTDNQNITTYRAVTNLYYGVSQWVSIGILLGGSKLHVDNPLSSGFNDFRGAGEIVYGGVARTDLLNVENRVFFFAGTGALQFKSQGTTTSLFEGVDRQEFKFDWKEYWFMNGVRYEHTRGELYTGMMLKNIDRFEKFRETGYSSGFRFSAFAGVDVHLPHNFSVNLHVRYGDE